MNGRIYDAKLGRFLQADPIVQAPKNSQSLNRYSYVINNPLSYTDPSGFSFFKKWGRIIAAVAISFILPGSGGLLYGWGVTSGLAQAAITGFVAGFITSGSLKGAVIGAFTAVAVYGLNQAFTDFNGTGQLDTEKITPSDEVIDHLYGESGPREGLHRVRVNPRDGTFFGSQAIEASGLRSGDEVFTNGMGNSFSDAVKNGTTQAYQAGLLDSSYVLNFNQSVSFGSDLLQSAGDVFGAHFGLGHSQLSKDLANALHTASANGVNGLTLIGHSQGGAITASALRYASGAGLNIGSVSSVALHGAPVNALYAKYGLSRSSGLNIVSRAQFGDPVHVFGGLNIHNPLQIPAAIARSPYLFSNDAAWSPHTVPCGGGRVGLCSP